MEKYYRTNKIPHYVLDVLNKYTEPLLASGKSKPVSKQTTLSPSSILDDVISEKFLQDAIKRHNYSQDCYRPEFQIMHDYSRMHEDRTEQEYTMIRNFKKDLSSETGMFADPLAAYYPKGGGLSWHNNADVPGYNILFTYSQNGDGFFRYQRDNKIITIEDEKGWNLKFMYYGGISETEKICWHTCASYDDRMTFAFLADDLVCRDFMDDCDVEEF